MRPQNNPQHILMLINICCYYNDAYQTIFIVTSQGKDHHTVTKSNLTLFAVQQTNESKRQGVEARLAPQNNHLIGVWMPDCFIDQRERSNEELKSKGRIERKMQWGSKVKGSSVLQNISKGMSKLQKGCVSLFYSQVGRDKLSVHKMKKGTLVQSQAEGQGPPGKPLSIIITIKASQRNSFQHGVKIGFLPATVPYYTLFSFVSSALRQKFGINIQLPVFPISSLPTS